MSNRRVMEENLDVDEDPLYGVYFYARGRVNLEERKYEDAIECFKKAVYLGNVEAMFWLGYMYYRSVGVDVDYQLAYRYYSQAADKLHVVAMNELGVMFEHGLGVERDLEKAFYWFHRSSALGDADGMCNLGVMYHFGLGCDIDFALAAKWFSKAAEKNHLSAMNSLAFLYESGRGLKKDVRKAFELYLDCANEGEEYSMINVSRCFEDGIGVPKCQTSANQWYQKALVGDKSDHLFQIGNYYLKGSALIKKNYDRALDFFRRVCEMNMDDRADSKRHREMSKKKINEILSLQLIDRNFGGFSRSHPRIIRLSDVVIRVKE